MRCVARTPPLSAPAKRGRGTTGAREASEPWWRGRRPRSFVVGTDGLQRRNRVVLHERKRASLMSAHDGNVGAALSPAPPPPPLRGGPPPPLSRWRMKMPLSRRRCLMAIQPDTGEVAEQR